MSGKVIRVLIVDDHLIVREGIRLILDTEPGIDLVGEASDGAEGVELAANLNPDVILMDLRMPGMDGLTAIEHLRRDQPEIEIVILTTFNRVYPELAAAVRHRWVCELTNPQMVRKMLV